MILEYDSKISLMHSHYLDLIRVIYRKMLFSELIKRDPHHLSIGTGLYSLMLSEKLGSENCQGKKEQFNGLRIKSAVLLEALDERAQE